MPLNAPMRPLSETLTVTGLSLDRPLIDVIIPCFNYGAYVADAVASILAQTLPHVGVIVIDGGSDDGTSPAIVKSLEQPRVRVFCREGRHYVGDNRNFGIARSHAKYVCCLDADDALDPTYLEKALYLMETYGYDLVSTSLKFTGNIEDMTEWNIPYRPSLDVLLVENQITTCAVYRRAMWEAVGGYQDYGIGAQHVPEDWDLWVRFAAVGARMRNISAECLLHYRLHSKDSLSRRADNLSLQEQRDMMLAKNRNFLAEAVRKRPKNSKIPKPTPDNDLVKTAMRYEPNPNTLMIVMPFMTVGGAERLLSNLTGFLIRRGWTIIAVATDAQEKAWGDTYDWFRKHTPNVYALPMFLEPGEWKGFLSYLIDVKKPHCILNLGSRIFYEMMPGITKKYPQLPLVDLLFNTVGHTKSHMEFRKYFTSAIAETGEVYQWLEKAGWNKDRITKIASGVDLQRFQPRMADKNLIEHYKIADDEIVVGFFGRLSEEKAPDVFVEIARQCAGNDKIRFVMAGAGNLVDEVQKQIKTLPPNARLDFVGRVDDVASLYSICDMLILSSRCDGRPMAVMEGLASGLPVIASRVGGVPEMVEDGINGYLCTPGNVAEFVKHIEALTQDKVLLWRLKDGARAYAEKHFDADFYFARYHDALYPTQQNTPSLPKSLPYRLTVLEQQGYTGGHERLPNELEGKVIWNLFLKDRYLGEAIPFTEAEKKRLLEPAVFQGYPVPNYIVLIDTIMGASFYEKACNGSPFKKVGMEYFLIDQVGYTLPLIAGRNFTLRPEWTKWMLQPAVLADSPECDGMPKLVVTSWLNSQDLRAQFDLTTHEGRYGFLGWLCRWRLPSLDGLHDLEWMAELNQPSRFVADAKQSGFSGLIEAIYHLDPANKKLFDLTTHKGRLGYVGHFCRWIMPTFHSYCHPEWLKAFLNAPSTSIPQADKNGITHYMEALCLATPDLIQDVTTEKGQRELLDFFMHVIPSIEANYVVPEWVQKVAAREKIALPKVSAATAQTSSSASTTSNTDDIKLAKPVPISSKSLLSGGANLIGWPQTEIGIGEDIRVAGDAFQSAKIPFAVIDAARRLPPLPAPVELGLEPFMTDEPRYDVDVVFLDASTQYRYYAFDALKNRPIDRTTIGVCPWELPLWPREVSFSLETLDIFWAATRYIRDAFAPYFPANKIMLASPAVVVPAHEIEGVVKLDRDGPFRFLTIFDGLSSIHRKNPIATVKAFQAAFPSNNRDVRLIVKMMNLPGSDPTLRALMKEIGKDDRIEIVNTTLARSALFALVKSAHCFASLHRSEGFGRNIAESMALGRPVITSAYSGNLDFCNTSNSYLVEGGEVAIEPDEYTFSKGQTWFDPSVDHAAAQMREVYNNWPRAVEVAAAGQKYILDFHSLEKTGLRYADLLKQV